MPRDIHIAAGTMVFGFVNPRHFPVTSNLILFAGVATREIEFDMMMEFWGQMFVVDAVDLIDTPVADEQGFDCTCLMWHSDLKVARKEFLAAYQEGLKDLRRDMVNAMKITREELVDANCIAR